MLLYHGTQAKFSAFDSDHLGKGYEANSALGLWTTRCPHTAHAYGQGRFLVLATPAPRLAVARCYHTTIWGGLDLTATDREIAWPRFVRARTTLMRLGFDGLWCEMPGTDLEGAVCLFRPECATLLHTMEASSDATRAERENPFDDSQVCFSITLEQALRATSRSPHTARE